MSPAAAQALPAAVAAVTGRPGGHLERLRREDLDYDAFLAHRTVHRVRGVQVHDAGETPWSLIEKRTAGPHLASTYLRDNAEREHAAYTSELLDDLAPHVRAPRLLGAAEAEDGALTLWLEEVRDQAPRPLDAAALLATARDLGALAGRHLGRVPEAPWMFTGWIARHAQPAAMPAGLRALERTGEGTAAALGNRLGEVRRLITAQPAVRAALERLPQTLCHHDAVGANVLRSRGSTVLIDWESVGAGPVGADLASLLFSSVRRGDASAAVVRAVRDEAVEAYLDGAATQTGRLDAAAVRHGVDLAISLRWKLGVDLVGSLERGEAPRRGSAPAEGPERAREELTLLCTLLLDSARRALGGA